MVSLDAKTLLVNAHSDDPFEQVQDLIELVKLHDESVVPRIPDLLSS